MYIDGDFNHQNISEDELWATNQWTLCVCEDEKDIATALCNWQALV